MLKRFKRSQEGSAVMKIFVGDLRSDERALVVGGLKRWALHMDLALEFTDQRKGCDLAMVDADQSQNVMALVDVEHAAKAAFVDVEHAAKAAFAHERVISIGQAKIPGADAHLNRPVRGFQLAAAVIEIMEKRQNAGGSRSALNFLHVLAA